MGEAGVICRRVVVGVLLMGLMGCGPSKSGKGELESALASQRAELAKERRAREAAELAAELAAKNAEYRVQSVRRMGLIFGISLCAMALFIGAGIGSGVKRDADG